MWLWLYSRLHTYISDGSVVVKKELSTALFMEMLLYMVWEGL